MSAMSVVILSALLTASPVQAETKQLMQYDVYAGGFHAVEAELTVDLEKKTNYMLRLGAHTRGFLAKLAPWKGVFQTKGWYDAKKDMPQPQLHFSDTTWKEDRELTEFEYNKDGSFKEYRVTENGKRKDERQERELSHDTTDVLSATLEVMNHIAQGGKCEGSDEIYDGERRYELIFANSKQVKLEKSDYNVYAGPATECTVEVKPISGKWHKKPRGWMSIQEQGREKGKMPTIWFAQMAPGEPAVPVKIRVKTDYGALFMHLTSYKGAGQSLKTAQK